MNGEKRMKYWLVEEHTTAYGVGEEDIPFHVVVEASTPQFAYNEANNISVKTRTRTWKDPTLGGTEPVEFLFSADELAECIPGYLWQAVDGSSIYYEVRYLGELQRNGIGDVRFK